MKYICYKSGASVDKILAWTDYEINHVDMAKTLEGSELLSAGFIAEVDGEVVCGGYSDTLDLYARGRDTTLVKAMLRAAEFRVKG